MGKLSGVSLYKKANNRILGTTIGLVAILIALLAGLTACGPPPASYSDPLTEMSEVRPDAAFPTLSLGVVLSDNARHAITHIEETRAYVRDSYHIMGRESRVKNLDPEYITKKLTRLLEQYFGDVIAIDSIEDAGSEGCDLCMVLDLRVTLRDTPWQDTEVFIGGIFTGVNGIIIETVSADGKATVPITADTYVFRPAADHALIAFSDNLALSTKLAAGLQRLEDGKQPRPQGAPPMTATSARPADDDDSASVFPSVPEDVRLGDYHALVIGINGYLALPPLQTAKNDAEAVAKSLTQDYGFRVTLLLDATRADIVTALDKLRQELGSDDNLLIYYAGHGWLDKDADTGYWLPADATDDSELNWISNSYITSTLKAIQAKHVLVVADSCYSGKLTRGLHIRRLTPNYLQRMAGKRARLALASGGLEPVADSGTDSQHSVFASAFLQALEENQGVMDGTRLFRLIRRPVMVNSDQVPEYADICKAGHAGGDFLFVRKK